MNPLDYQSAEFKQALLKFFDDAQVLLDENARLREYVNDNGDRFAAVVKQRDAAEAAVAALADACRYALQFIEEYDPDLRLHPSLRAKLKKALAAVK